jgi:hypothetical protein
MGDNTLIQTLSLFYRSFLGLRLYYHLTILLGSFMTTLAGGGGHTGVGRKIAVNILNRCSRSGEGTIMG